MKKRILSLVTILTMLASLIVLPTTAQAETTIKLGDYVQMGTYYGEPILWRCVSFEKISGYDSDGNPIIDSTDTVTKYQDGYLPLMLSDKIITLKAFDAKPSTNKETGSHSRGEYGTRQTSGSNYWADSNLRSWLNSNESAGNVEWLCGNAPTDGYVENGNAYADEAGFLTNFTQNELNIINAVTQKCIVQAPEFDNGIYDSGSERYKSSTYVEDLVQNYDKAYSEQATDKVFLLDVKQVNEIYNNSNILGDDYHIGNPSDVCDANSEHFVQEYTVYAGSNCYWLRTPLYYTLGEYDVGTINAGGYILGGPAEDGGCGVRPAFFLSDVATFAFGRGSDNDPYSIVETNNTSTTDGEIKIYLNNNRLTFDQPPINQDGNLLVPIRAIAEAMGKSVLWSDKYNVAFIDNTDNALIIPIGETTLYLGNEQAYSTWGQKKTNVPSQVINGRTLVPVRQFAEALGATVDWNNEQQTAYITYDNIDSEEMSDDLYDAINLNYYIGHYSSNPFEKYNEDAIEPFYESRNSTIDAIAMGISKPWSAINDLISSFYGNTNASNIIQQTLYDVISEIDDTSDSSLADTSILTDLVSYEKAGIKIYNDASGFDKDFLEAHPDLKSLNDSIKNASTALDWFIFTTDELAYILTNYSMNISYLDVFEEALSSNGELDDNIQEAIDDLRDQYANKFLELLIDVQEELTNNTFSSAMSLVTGGAYSLGKLAWKTVFKATGVTKKGEALKTFYGIYCYNAGLDRAFDSAMKSSKDSVDLPNIKALIQIQKATKKTAIESIKDIAYSWATEEKAVAQTYIDQLDSWTYYIWDAPASDGSLDGSGGGGGSSW